MADPTLVLLSLPIEFEGPDGTEFGRCCVKNREVDVVAQVDPDEDEEEEVRANDDGIQVIQGFRGLVTKEREGFSEKTF